MMEWTYKENHIAIIAVYKYGIERARVFELLKLLHIKHVFLYCTVNLFLNMEGESDRRRSGWPRVVCTPQVINAVRSRINRNPVQKQQKNHGLGNILHREP
jgi:hypothetical protein